MDHKHIDCHKNYLFIGETTFRFSEYSSLRNSVFSQKSSSSSNVRKYVRCTVKFPFGVDLDGNGGGSAANLTKVLLFRKTLFYYIVCWGLVLIARPEEHTRTKIL